VFAQSSKRTRWLTPWAMAVFQTYLSFRAEREVFFDIPSTRKLQVKILPSSDALPRPVFCG